MKFLKAIFDFYVGSSLHVAIAVSSMLYLTAFEYDFTLNYNLLGFVFFGTISGYNFVKYFGVAKFHHRSLTNKLKVIQVFSFLSFLALLYFVYFLKPQLYWYCLGLALLTFHYAIPLFGMKNIRMLSGLKIFIVALVWSVATVILPIEDVYGQLDLDNWLSFIQRYIMVVVLTIPFEIRDLKYDNTALGTLPQQIGINASKWLAVIFMYFGFTLDLFKDDISCSHMSAFALTAFICALALWGSKKEQKTYYASFWVESIPIVWAILFYFLKFYFEISC